MADIEHRDIPDSGRHEPKGASTALEHTIAVADGIGGTTFKKITGDSLSGSVGSGPVSVKSNGEFTTSETAHAFIAKTSSNQATFIGSNSGVVIASGNFRVTESGVYYIAASNGITVTSTSIYSPQTEFYPPRVSTNSVVNYPVFRNVTTNSTMFTGVSGIHTLTEGVVYGFSNSALNFTIMRVS